MLMYILIGLAVLIVGFLALAALQSPAFRVTRSKKINASQAAVFDQVNDLHNWDAWSPWAKMDPDMQLTYSGPRSGVGANYSWVGNRNVGEGSMTITESHPSDIVRMKLDFVKPFKCSNDVEFNFRPDGDATVVTWTMTGNKKFINKAVCLVINMDKMCGGQFDQGLTAMKQVVEGPSFAGSPQPFSSPSGEAAI